MKAPRVAPEPLPVVPQSGRTNVALAANGSVATASSTYPDYGFTPGAPIDGEHKGLNWLNGGGWNCATPTFPQWVQVDFNATRTIDEIDVFSAQDDYLNPIEPTETTTFSLYGMTAFDVQYWTGSAWVTVSGGSVSENNKVWKKITFSAISTTKIRMVTNGSVDGWSRIPEIEAWGPATSTRTNVALAANGSVATASSTYPDYGFTPGAAIDGEHKGLNWLNGGGWNCATPTFPQWVQVDFNATRTIDEIDVFSAQDDYLNPIEPTETTTFSLYGMTAFDVQYWTGSAWVTVLGGSVSENNKVWKKITFSAISTTKIRMVTNGSVDVWSRIPEIEAWSALSGGGISPSDFAMARLDPRNRTGRGGEDLLSNNFNWNLPLVGLNGRGLDLGLTLSYNSLVWTKAGNSINFDLDQGSIAPGFRLGFPTVEGPYFNSQANANFYLLVTPSGGRVELRQVGTSTVYEAKDSSYLQFTDNLDGTATLRPTDGSKMNFIPSSGGWRCNQIKDRNGNYITATYKSWGELETVTDTLGRVLTFNYDGNDNLQSITQVWGGQTHEWATFGWSSAAIGNNFPGLNNYGPNSTSIAVLTQVGLPDGSRYNFEYNNTYGQISTIRHYASDPNNPNHERSQTTYLFSADGTDCPRITQRKDAAEYWTGFNGVPSEVVTQFAHDTDGACRMTAPDGTVYKEYYGSSWQSALTTQSEIWSAGARQKWTTITWTQDNMNVGYLTNPRVLQADVEDTSGNHRRTTIDYGAVNLGYLQWGLPHIVREYGVNGATATEFRRTQTDYNLSQDYLNRRLIGLVSTSQLYDAVANQWQAKVTYGYDGNSIDSQATTAAQHDPTYNSNFTVRGNVTSISRWDVTDIDNSGKKLTSTVTYDAAGSVLTSGDPAGHTTSIEYADSFSDNQNHNTFAYPTTVKDADNFTSTIKYNYYFGAKTRTQSPPPVGQSQGAIQTLAYDNAARLQRVTTVNTGAYTHYVYGPYYIQSYSSVNNVAANYWESDLYSITTFDGVGRAFTTTTNHPGSDSGYKLVNVIFDQMGRPFRQSNPTEVNSSWLPAGDDAYNPATGEGGVRYSVLDFDWKGRTTRETHPDGAYTEASYSGCGCAGGEVVTHTDEVGRRQKVYSDVLGRMSKTEVLNWDGSVYSTMTTSLNARDQVTLVRQWAGVENGTGTYQDTTMSYDGYGRLQSKHVPQQQDQNGNPTYTTWAYNTDDTVQSVTDTRGAYSTFTYNARHLVIQVSYNPSAGVPDTPEVLFGYDAAGNRISMTDGVGTMTYNYDQLSRMNWEERTFTGFSGTYRLSYSYNLAGQLTSLAEPSQFGAVVNYALDTAGRLATVTASGMQVSSLMTGLQYRASGALKHAEYGDGTQVNLTYNSRQLLTRYELNNVKDGTAWPYPYTTMGSQNQYYDDGRVQYTQDLRNGNFDRGYSFDHAGRLEIATSGREARGEAPANPVDSPYKQTFSYDAWGNMGRTGRLWSEGQGDNPTYTNNRRSDWYYDNAGNALLTFPYKDHKYDAAGQQVNVYEEFWSDGSETWVANQNTIDQVYDGTGQPGKRVETRHSEDYQGTITNEVRTVYFLRSSVLGGAVISEINENGLLVGHVYVGGEKIADYSGWAPYGTIRLRHTNPTNGNWITVQVPSNFGTRTELDPLGATVGTTDLFAVQRNYNNMVGNDWLYQQLGNPFDLGSGCSGRIDGMAASCSEILNSMERGSAVPCPNNDCGARMVNGRMTPFDSSRARVQNNGLSMYAVTYNWGEDLGVVGRRWDPQVGEWVDVLGSTSYTTTRYFSFASGPQNSIRDVTAIINKVRFLGDNVNNPKLKSMLQDRLHVLLTRGCAEAFKLAGLATPEEIINKGITIADRPLLDDASNNATFGLSEQTRQGFAKSQAPALTIRSQFTSKGPIIFLRAEAFADLDYLDEAVAHEFVHAAGEGQHTLWGYRLGRGTDLSGFEHYQDIINYCGFDRHNR